MTTSNPQLSLLFNAFQHLRQDVNKLAWLFEEEKYARSSPSTPDSTNDPERAATSALDSGG